MAHGFVVPLVILWVVWRERDRWRSLPRKTSLWGYAILALAAGLDFAGALGVGLFARSLAFLLSVAGAILCLGGFAWLRVWTFPFVLALFMLPKLAIVYNQVTLPLQLLATRLAATDAYRSRVRGGPIRQHSERSGSSNCGGGSLRWYPLSDSFGLHRAGSRLPERFETVDANRAGAGGGPVAILANGIRVAAAAPIPALATGPMHSMAGWLIFLLCLITLALVHRSDPKQCTPAMLSDWPRTLVPVFLTAQRLLVYFAAGRENLPATPVLSGFPAKFSEWSQLREDPLEPELVNDLHADQLLNRIYVNRPTGSLASLFLAWFQSQRGGKSQPHSPKVCLPASGWVPEATGEMNIETAGGTYSRESLSGC